MIASTLTSAASEPVRLITLDPGHFHAALVQKFMYPQVSPEVHVYAPEGPDLTLHLKRIEGFNTRAENPTRWQERVYSGADFLKRMTRERPGNVVVLAGNNTRKTRYLYDSVDAGFNVLADKPMAINPADFKLLRKAFERAAKKNVLLYDLMTERYEITCMLQRELARQPEVFGQLQAGTPEQPGVEMESMHYFFKEVAGKPLIRPAWFFDVRQEGEAIPDVGTHLVDLVQWACFPDQTLDWKKDIQVRQARRWPTSLTPEQFQRATGVAQFPDYLRKDVGADGRLNVFQNGEINYTLRGVHVKVAALWDFEPPPGSKDSHYAVMRGTRAALVIRQTAEEAFVPTLYVEDSAGRGTNAVGVALRKAVSRLCSTWPGIEVEEVRNPKLEIRKKSETRNSNQPRAVWKILVPEKYHVGHEAHFAQVTEKYLQYLADGKLADWEVPNMLAKYYTTTEAFRLGHTRQTAP